MLEIKNLNVMYGQHLALSDVSASVNAGEMVAVLGANGAGKSSLLGAVGGRVPPKSGSVTYQGHDLSTRTRHDLVEMGIAYVPEGRGIFPSLSVAENLALGAYPSRARDGAQSKLNEVFELFPKLAERKTQIASTMSGGEQQMVAIGRALMSSPDLLLLDEPSLGLAPIVVKEVFSALSRIRASGLTIVIVEQNARATLDLADRAYLMEAGQITGSGKSTDLQNDPEIIRTFLGGAAAPQTERHH